MQSDSGTVLEHVAGNVRRLRQAGGLSQEQLAQRSGLSRRTIINLEAGEANISLAGLDRVADALGSSFSELIRAPGTEARSIAALAWRGEKAESQALLLGAAPAHQEAQLWRWTLAAGERYQAEPDPAGWHELVYVIAGELTIERGEGDVAVGPGGFSIYSSAQPYAYVNHGGVPAEFIRVVAS